MRVAEGAHPSLACGLRALRPRLRPLSSQPLCSQLGAAGLVLLVAMLSLLSLLEPLVGSVRLV